MEQKTIEQQTLLVNFSINGILAVSACWAYASSGIQAVFLDAGFSIMVLLSSVAALVISRTSGKRGGRFPEGRYLYEPLYALVKSLINMVLLLISTISSLQHLLAFAVNDSMSKLNFLPIIPYVLLMIVLSFGLSAYAKYQNRRIRDSSTLLAADSKTAFVDGLMASGVALGVLLLLFIDESSPFSFLLYIGDALITLVLVAFAVKRPVCLFKESFFELVGGVLPDGVLSQEIREVVDRNLPEGARLKDCYVRKKGMSYQVTANLDYHSELVELDPLRKSRKQIEEELSSKCTNLNLQMIVW